MPNPNSAGYPTGGITAVALRNATSPTKVQMADPSFVITTIPGWVVLGLRSSDGAPDWQESPAGFDEVYEEGYRYSQQNGTLTMAQNLIEQNPAVLSLLRGVTYTNGVADIDVNLQTECKVYTEDRLKTKAGDMLERYMAPVATVTGITTSRKTRGSMANRPVTFTADRSDEIDNRGHYRHALIAATSTPAPYINSVIPAGLKIGDSVVITGGKFTGMTSVKFAAVSAVTPLLADDGTIVAKIPAGSVGTVPVTVVTANGTSNAVSYTVTV